MNRCLIALICLVLITSAAAAGGRDVIHMRACEIDIHEGLPPLPADFRWQTMDSNVCHRRFHCTAASGR